MLPPTLIAIFVFAFGLIVGSFLNVCISRLPHGQSIVKPPSRCPKCQTRIKPYDNIPVLSYLLLGGKCRSCKARISPIYPAVELLTALLFLACYSVFDESLVKTKWLTFSAVLIVLAFTDIQKRILPNTVNLFGFVAGVLFTFAGVSVSGPAVQLSNSIFAYPPPIPVLSFVNALFGAVLGSGTLLVVPFLYFWVKGVYLSLKRGKLNLRGLPWYKGMGMGDIKMMAMVGTFLGPWLTLLTILAGSLLGSIGGFFLIGLLFMFGWKKSVAERASKMGLGKPRKLRFALALRYQLPFGTYLAVAAMLVVFFGQPVIDWYQSLLVIR